jgi:hypothetical protein
MEASVSSMSPRNSPLADRSRTLCRSHAKGSTLLPGGLISTAVSIALRGSWCQDFGRSLRMVITHGTNGASDAPCKSDQDRTRPGDPPSGASIHALYSLRQRPRAELGSGEVD